VSEYTAYTAKHIN